VPVPEGETGWKDQVADPEQRVITRVALVEEVLGVGHQIRRAEHVPDFVDFAAFHVLEHGNRSEGEIHPPVRRHPRVDATAAGVLDQRDQAVELGYTAPSPNREMETKLDSGRCPLRSCRVAKRTICSWTELSSR
jgi:hypothetical protein